MKKIIRCFCILLFFPAIAFTQAPPQGINYQAIARDASGKELVSKSISVRFSIKSNSATGPVVYQESHAPVTNAFGLFTLVIGNGTPISGTFSSINWGAGNHFLEVELDPNGGTIYTSVGTTQFMSVPYALFAKNALNSPAGLNCWDLNGNNVKDPAEDSNGDNIWDALDCKGIKGDIGATGPQGIQGLQGNQGAQGPQGAQGSQGPQGIQGVQGTQGTSGTAGINCWDLNGNGINDPAEDSNGDNTWDALDCKGLKGDPGIAGAQGIQGTQGISGTNGLNCWDLNGNGIKETSEDINTDGLWNTLDCKGSGGTGTLPAGQMHETLRHNGANWISNNLLFNNAISIGVGTTTPDGAAKLHVSGKFKLTDGTEGVGKVLTSDPTGIASWQPSTSLVSKIAFRANSNSQQLLSNVTTKMIFSIEAFDDGTGYDPATSTYTVPSDGLYYIESSVAFTAMSGSSGVRLSIDNNGTILATGSIINESGSTSSLPESCRVSGIFKLLTGNKITILAAVPNSSNKSNVAEQNWFLAYKIY